MCQRALLTVLYYRHGLYEREDRRSLPLPNANDLAPALSVSGVLRDLVSPQDSGPSLVFSYGMEGA